MYFAALRFLSVPSVVNSPYFRPDTDRISPGPPPGEGVLIQRNGSAIIQRGGGFILLREPPLPKLLQEDGSAILQEDGSVILLDT
jgi:hypothetical protein